MDITPAQCRAARGLLDIDQGRLAAAAEISKRTVAAFERGGRLIPATKSAIRRALEEAGVEFIEGGVRFARRDEPR